MTKPIERLTVPEVCAELRVSRATFYRWLQTGRGPRWMKLPNGKIRVSRAALDSWLTDLGSGRPA
jgi:excisionase family DNA binding protein